MQECLLRLKDEEPSPALLSLLAPIFVSLGVNQSALEQHGIFDVSESQKLLKRFARHLASVLGGLVAAGLDHSDTTILYRHQQVLLLLEVLGILGYNQRQLRKADIDINLLYAKTYIAQDKTQDLANRIRMVLLSTFAFRDGFKQPVSALDITTLEGRRFITQQTQHMLENQSGQERLEVLESLITAVKDQKNDANIGALLQIKQVLVHCPGRSMLSNLSPRTNFHRSSGDS